MKTTKDVTIYDVAEALNISPSTVSRGLKDHPHIHKDTKKKNLGSGKRDGISAKQVCQQFEKETYGNHWSGGSQTE